MNEALVLHRFHFAFNSAFHYLFPQLTMGLALLIVILKTRALLRGDPKMHDAARFWARIFGINFVMGVVTGIPLEFMFGTNWSQFSLGAGAVIGQTLAMEGTFAFFIESSFLGLFLFGEKRLSPWAHWFSAFMVFVGSWLSGFFIVVTNAWMQHPTGYTTGPNGEILLASFWGLVLNPWGLWQYLHTMSGSVVTAAVVMASIGAYYLLAGEHREHARIFVRLGVVTGLVAAVLQMVPTGDMQGRMIARHQPATLAAMEGLFRTEVGAPLVILGQPDVEKQRIDNPLAIPRMLSFLTYQAWAAEVKGLDAFPREDWPDQIPLLYYSYRIMVGLGTIFIAVLLLAGLRMWTGKLEGTRWLLWALMLLLPFPYIANTAGWMTAELGRQPWLIHGLMRTAAGVSANVSAGNAWFTLLGFMGLYTALGLLFLLLVVREIAHGPAPAPKKGR